MKQFDDLIESYSESGMDSGSVVTWYAQTSPSAEMLSTLAEHIGAEFLSGRVSFNMANGLLNQLMPLVGFDAAPKRFWQYYIAFENSETLNDPGTHARWAVNVLAIKGSG